MPAHKNQISDLEKLLRNAAASLGIELKAKSLIPYRDEHGNAHYLLPDLVYEDAAVKIAIEIAGEYGNRAKPEHQRKKEAALRQLGFTVIYFDLEASDQSEIEAFAAELQRLIFQKKGAAATESTEYLTGTVNLEQKLAAKITARQQGKKTEPKRAIIVPEIQTLEKTKAEKLPLGQRTDSAQFSLQALMAGQKPQPPEAPSAPSNASENKHFHPFSAALIGAAVLIVGLVGIMKLPFLQESAVLQRFSASLLQSAELEFTLPEGSFSLPTATAPVLANSSDQPAISSVQIALPPHTELVKYQNTYLLRCSAEAQKVPGVNACVPRLEK